MEEAIDKSPEVWSRFWRQGHATTFGNYYDKGYQGPILHWLKEVVPPASSTDSARNILELCAGNGSLIPFLLDSNEHCHYVGVDSADVTVPEQYNARIAMTPSSFDLRPRCNVEKLPSDIADAELALSIYGIEYSDLQVTMTNLHEVMDSCGKFVGLLHHHESVVAKLSRRAIAEYDADDISQTLRYLEVIHQAAVEVDSLQDLKTHPKAEEARTAINNVASRYLGKDLATGNAFMADFITFALRFFKLLSQPVTVREGFLNDLESEMSSALTRHRQMVSVALDEARIKALVETMESAGWQHVDFSVRRFNEEVIGWQLSAQA